MPLYMIWTQNVIVVGKVDENEINAVPPAQRPVIRVHRPMMVMEQVKQGRLGVPEVNVAFGPLLASAYVDWVDVKWIMLAPLDSMKKAEKLAAAYESISADLHTKVTTGIEVVGRMPDAVVNDIEQAAKMRAKED